MTQIELLEALHEEFCPLVESSDGFWRCYYCDANLDVGDKHEHDCLWVELERIVYEG